MVEWTADAAVRDAVVVQDSAVAAADGERASSEATTTQGSGPRLRWWGSAARARIRSAAARLALIAQTRGEAGMSTAEYAVGTIAACGFAALLWKILTSGEVRSMLSALVQKALKLAG